MLKMKRPVNLLEGKLEKIHTFNDSNQINA